MWFSPPGQSRSGNAMYSMVPLEPSVSACVCVCVDGCVCVYMCGGVCVCDDEKVRGPAAVLHQM
jgi:hypothetical protein